MAKVPPDMKQFTTQVPAELYDAFAALAARLGRPFAREVAEAFRRHLANPPRLVQEPHPDRAVVEEPPPRPVGRPARAAQKDRPPPPRPAERRTTARQERAERAAALEQLRQLDGIKVLKDDGEPCQNAD